MFLFLIISLFVTIAAINYCDPQLCSPEEIHIGCGNLGKFVSTCPADAQLVTIADKEIKIFLDQHNSFRNSTASGKVPGLKSATRMPTLVGDTQFHIKKLTDNVIIRYGTRN